MGTANSTWVMKVAVGNNTFPQSFMPAKSYAERKKFPLQNSQTDMSGNHALPPLPFGITRPKQNKA